MNECLIVLEKRGGNFWHRPSLLSNRMRGQRYITDGRQGTARNTPSPAPSDKCTRSHFVRRSKLLNSQHVAWKCPRSRRVTKWRETARGWTAPQPQPHNVLIP